MEMHLLEKYIAVAEERHFGKAAMRLNMSQPPLSQAVQRLEEELGVVLLERNRRKVRLTPAGQAFLDEARGVLRQVETAVARAKRFASGEAGSVMLGFVGPAANAGIPERIRVFRERYPDIDVTLEELTTRVQVGRLMAGELDVGVVRLHTGLAEPPAGMESRVLHREPYMLALPQGHPLMKRDIVPLSALEGVPQIFFPRANGPALHDAMMQTCAEAGFTPHIVQEVERKSTTLALVGAGIGCAMVPRSSCRAPSSGVAFRSLSGDLPMVELHLLWVAGAVNPARDVFVAALLDGKP